jgi:hypothetical protein
MHTDIWVISVLRDIQQFARKRGHSRLVAVLDMAADEFLKDVDDMKAARFGGLALEGRDISKKCLSARNKPRN